MATVTPPASPLYSPESSDASETQVVDDAIVPEVLGDAPEKAEPEVLGDAPEKAEPEVLGDAPEKADSEVATSDAVPEALRTLSAPEGALPAVPEALRTLSAPIPPAPMPVGKTSPTKKRQRTV